MKKVFLVLVAVILSTLLYSCGPKVILLDVIGLDYQEALLEINGKYKVTSVSKPTNQFLPNTVIEYKDARPGDEVKAEGIELVVSDYPEGAIYPTDSNSIIDYAYKIDYITGPESPNFDLLINSGVGGTDLGFQIELPNNEYMMVFGDTFSNVGNHSGWWNSNFMAIGNDHELWDGITMDRLVTLPMGMVKPFAQGKHSQDYPDEESNDPTREVTKIPTGGILIGEYVYIFYMSIRTWANWSVSYNQCVKAHISDLTNFVEVEGLRWNEDEAFHHGQINPIYDPISNYYYFYSIPGGRADGVVLSRVASQNFENRGEYEYYVNKTSWIKGDEGLLALKNNKDESLIISPSVSELSAFYNEYLEKWVISFKRGGSLVLATSDNPIGPWNTDTRIQMDGYAGIGSKMFQDFGGKKMYFIFSDWIPVYQSRIAEVVLK